MSRNIVHALRREVRAIPAAELNARHSSKSIARAVACGELVRVLPGYYAADVHAESFAVRIDAVAGWLPAGGAVTGRAAMRVRGQLDVPPDVIDAVVPYPLRRRSPSWLRLKSAVDAVDVSVHWGIPLEGRAPSLVRAYEAEPERTRDDLVYAALRTKAVSVSQLRQVAETRARLRGRRHLLTLASRFASGRESFLEHKASTSVFVGAAFEGLIRQHRVVVEGRAFRLDNYDPETMTAFETDGEQAHSLPESRARDRERDVLLASVGIETVRFTYRDVMERPQWCRRIARQVLARRRYGSG